MTSFLYPDTIIKPIIGLTVTENGLMDYLSGEIREHAESGKSFQLTQDIVFPPLADCIVKDVVYKPEGLIEIHARVGDEKIEEKATSCAYALPQHREAAFQSLWLVKKDDGLVRRFFREPEQVFRFLMSKVFNRFSPSIERFIDAGLATN
ncbi:MAG: hypothetical protein O3C63_07555 [Cyanobacteria bacterium]|nr:hypothetical protein [Cyanobacteriota bacterium]